MRLLIRWGMVVVLVLTSWPVPPRLAHAANQDTIADRVFGQPGFSSGDSNHGGLSATSLHFPSGPALDARGNLYVADTNNNRVLEYDAPLSTGAAANRVFGQTNVFTNTPNSGGLSARSLRSPQAVALDAQGNLYVADTTNNRVLEYDAPLSSGMAANRVIGQPDLNSSASNNGGLSATSLATPFAVALDLQGNLYVADFANNRVLEYDAPLTTGAAASRVFGQPDFIHNTVNNGGVSASSLSTPFGVAVDAQGNLYVPDSTNNRVLEYDAPLTTGMAANRVIGQPNFSQFAANNGGLSATSLATPFAAAVDAHGNLYVADAGNNRVLEYDTPLTSSMAASHVFGQPGFLQNSSNNPGVTASSLYDPTGVALDAQGNLYVVDGGNSRVLEYDVPVPYGVPALTALSPSTVAAGSPPFVLTVNGSGFVAGSLVRWNGSDRPTTYLNSTQLNAAISATDIAAGGPFAVTVFTPPPGGGTSNVVHLTLYARLEKDTMADAVQGQPNFAANTPNNLLMPSANRLNSPNGAGVASSSGRLFVADSGNNRVLSWPNAPSFANGQPADLVLGQPNFVANDGNQGGLSAASLAYPSGVALDGHGNLYVADTSNNRVLEYNAPLSSGMAASRVFGQSGSFIAGAPNNGGVSANSLSSPYGLALDAQGNLYVADTANNRVLEYDTPVTAGTTASSVFGQANFAATTPNSGGLSASSLSSPYGVALDKQGSLYVTDYSNNRVLEYDAPLTTDHIADHVFGQPDFSSGAANDGGVSATSLSSPIGVALDGSGRLYVADAGNSRVLEYITPLTTTGADRVFGQPDFTSNAINNGGPNATSLYGSWGVALDALGNLYVADTGNSRVLEYDWARDKLFLPLVRR